MAIEYGPQMHEFWSGIVWNIMPIPFELSDCPRRRASSRASPLGDSPPPLPGLATQRLCRIPQAGLRRPDTIVALLNHQLQTGLPTNTYPSRPMRGSRRAAVGRTPTEGTARAPPAPNGARSTGRGGTSRAVVITVYRKLRTARVLTRPQWSDFRGRGPGLRQPG